MNWEWTTFRHLEGNGYKMVVDMKKRLTNALRDAKLNNKNVPTFIEWLEKASLYDNTLKHTGSMGLYILSR